MSAAVTVCSMAAASGVILVGSWAVERRRRMWRQIAPFVGSIVPESRVKVSLERGLGMLLAHRVGWAWGSDRHIRHLCQAMGGDRTVPQVRIQQVVHSGVATAAVLGWSLLRQLTHPGATNGVTVAALLGAPIAGGWWTRAHLETSVSTRARTMDMQLPTVLELLAFSISAGESMYSALDRVARTLDGALAEQLRVAVRDIGAGQSIAVALRDLASATSSPAVSRAAHAIDIALERGTPLAEVLRNQAADARAHMMRQLLVLAGRKETSMMIPVVFLILPTIVAVAVYPGIVQLHMW